MESDSLAEKGTEKVCRQENAYGWLEEIDDEDESDSGVQTSIGSAVSKGDLSEDQLAAYDRIEKWLTDPDDTRQVLTLGGFAGTGKTTLISLIAKSRKMCVAFCAYTGKASNVLKQKLAAANVDAAFFGTIHRMIYRPLTDEKTGAISSWARVDELPYDLIVVDEASMVDEAMFNDLLKYDVPILAVGDHGQLPPVKSSFNLMAAPVVKLEHIHRQAEDNPIIRLSADIRHHGISAIQSNMVYPMSSVGGMFAGYFKEKDRALSTAMLCFTNKKRIALNSALRSAVLDDASETLAPSDLVVCLKNTRFDHDFIFNGMRGSVVKSTLRSKTSTAQLKALVEFPDDKLRLYANLNKSQFGREKTISSFADAGLPDYSHWPDVGMLFDYGYCLTAHKAQGSEFADVAVVLEHMSYMEEDFIRRWLYTSVTRASKRLYLVRP